MQQVEARDRGLDKWEGWIFTATGQEVDAEMKTLNGTSQAQAAIGARTNSNT